jgi:hypothetical protein
MFLQFVVHTNSHNNNAEQQLELPMTLLTLRRTHTAVRGTYAFCLMALIGLFGLLAGCDGQSGSASGSSSPTLSSISVTPAAPSVAAGLTEQLTAMGIYSDGSKRDVSQSVTGRIRNFVGEAV